MANCHTILCYSIGISIFSIILLPYTLQMLTHYWSPYVLIYMVASYHAVRHKFHRFFYHAAGIFHCHVLEGWSRVSTRYSWIWSHTPLASVTSGWLKSMETSVHAMAAQESRSNTQILLLHLKCIDHLIIYSRPLITIRAFTKPASDECLLPLPYKCPVFLSPGSTPT